MDDVVHTIITVASVIAAVGVIGGLFIGVHKILTRFDRLEVETKARKSENMLIMKSVYALCDGLHQLGANGVITEARRSLEKYNIEH